GSQLADTDAELTALLARVQDAYQRQVPPLELAEVWGLRRGGTGYIYHTVPLALYCLLRSPGGFRRAVGEVSCLGGDADTTGAITGALAGAAVGAAGIPAEWLRGVIDWPRSVGWMRSLACRLAERFPGAETGIDRGPQPLFWPGLLPRNLFFLLVVLLHGF